MRRWFNSGSLPPQNCLRPFECLGRLRCGGDPRCSNHPDYIPPWADEAWLAKLAKKKRRKKGASKPVR